MTFKLQGRIMTDRQTASGRRDPTLSGLLLQAAADLALRAAMARLARLIPPAPVLPARQQPETPPPAAPIADPALDGSGVIFTAKRVWEEIGKDRVLSVAGGLTFFSLLALFPAITALVSIFGLFSDPSQISTYLGGVTTVLPKETAAILVDQAKAISSAGSANLSLAAIIAIALALWSSNGGTKALIEALNVAYGVKEERGFIHLNLMSLGATILGIIFALAIVLGVAVLPTLLEYIWLGPLTETLLLVGRWPAVFVLMMLFLAAAYRFGPNRPDATWRWITPGSAMAAAGLVLFSLLFNWYVQNFANYNKTYGSLGAVIALMTWMWLSATLILVGAEVNSELDRQQMSAAKKGPVAAPANASR